jgi:hypothetical protein
LFFLEEAAWKIQVRENLGKIVYLLLFPDLCMILPLPETDHPGEETKTVDPRGPDAKQKTNFDLLD